MRHIKKKEIDFALNTHNNTNNLFTLFKTVLLKESSFDTCAIQKNNFYVCATIKTNRNFFCAPIIPPFIGWH